ncbi:MAG: DUF1028 domain-containing protein [Candidatus Aegiribacteria sp.]|nr:DUF1028 domain-containing protein [Candidatus Aegiribacteria sp.]
MIPLLGVIMVIIGIVPITEDYSGWTSTFSIAAYDSYTGELGVAVASCVPFVGHEVPWVEAGTGAIATQAQVNRAFGPDGLDLLREALSAADVMDSLISADPEREVRQLGIVDAAGEAVSFTGSETFSWSGGVTGNGYAVQGNILTGEDVILDMESTFLRTEGPLAVRLLAALQAGEDAGGDSRGKQSAAILVTRANGGHHGCSDRFVDICVSDHENPVSELIRLYAIWEEYNVFPVYLDAGTELETQWALDIMERSLQNTEPDPQVLNYYAWTLAERGLQPERAVALAEQALELAPQDHNIMDTLAEALFRSGDAESAVEWELRALELDPDNGFYQSQLSRFRDEPEE